MFINLTQHKASPEQVEAGLEDLPADIRHDFLKLALTFNEPPEAEIIERRAEILSGLAKGFGASRALIGGAPYLMSEFERQLLKVGIQPFYSFSKRVSEETEDAAKSATLLTTISSLVYALRESAKSATLLTITHCSQRINNLSAKSSTLLTTRADHQKQLNYHQFAVL